MTEMEITGSVKKEILEDHPNNETHWQMLHSLDRQSKLKELPKLQEVDAWGGFLRCFYDSSKKSKPFVLRLRRHKGLSCVVKQNKEIECKDLLVLVSQPEPSPSNTDSESEAK